MELVAGSLEGGPQSNSRAHRGEKTLCACVRVHACGWWRQVFGVCRVA